MATKQETITKFQLYMDDTTELSSQEESDLYDKVYRHICNSRPWEILKKEFSGTQSTTVPYIALPTDFSFLVQNANYTDASYEASRPVIFIGSQYERYEVVSWSDRRQYRNQFGFAYVDPVNSRLYFTAQPTSAQSVEFDYLSRPTSLALSETPVFPDPISDAIYHGMCVDDFIIQQSDKAKSYKDENERMFKKYLSDLAYWNANLIQM